MDSSTLSEKITQGSDETASEVIKEVRLLSRLNHPAVVRVLLIPGWKRCPTMKPSEG